jgi:hypothetical protein
MSRGRFGPVASGLGLVVVLAMAPAAAEAQVFLASRPHPGLAVTPLFVVASVGSDAPDVPVEVLFSLMIPPDKMGPALAGRGPRVGRRATRGRDHRGR